jgi:hypothetical protein
MVEFEADFDDAREILYENAVFLNIQSRLRVLREVKLGAGFPVFSEDNQEIGTIVITPLDDNPDYR